MYRIITNDNPVQLGKQVSAAYEAGYYPWGDLIITHVMVDGNTAVLYTQVVIQTGDVETMTAEPTLN